MWVLAKKFTPSLLPIVYQLILVKVKGFGFQVPSKMDMKITVTFHVPLKFSEGII